MSAKRRSKKSGDVPENGEPAVVSDADASFAEGLKEFDRARQVAKRVRKRIDTFKNKGKINPASIRALLNSLDTICR